MRSQGLPGEWHARLTDLCDRIRRAVSQRSADPDRARPAARGVGDVSFGLDVASEEAVAAWSEEIARREPFSLLTEERGWQHVGPATRSGGVRELETFDHGGPRIAIDPIDGTRNLMFGLRSAWTVVSFAGPGAATPRLGDVAHGLVSEIPAVPDARVARYEGGLGGGARSDGRMLRADEDTRVDHGYFPFFSYHPAMRPIVAGLAARFFERIERHENADLSHCYDDQYISSAGQLVHVMLGSYRMVVEARNLLARLYGRTTQVSKPYDMAGAIVVAREAGCVV